MNNLTLIIPAKKEKESLPLVLDELKKFECKKKVVLEESDEETINSIKNYDCEIFFQSGKGYGNALIEGINNCQTELFCIFNADGSFDPKELINMLNKLKIENLEFVFGSRYQKDSGSDDDTIITLVGNFIFTFIGKFFFRLPITDILYTYVLGKTYSAKKLNLKANDFTFCVELPIKIQRLKMRMGSISSFERRRISGVKKVNAFKDGFKILMKMIFLIKKN